MDSSCSPAALLRVCFGSAAWPDPQPGSDPRLPMHEVQQSLCQSDGARGTLPPTAWRSSRAAALCGVIGVPCLRDRLPRSALFGSGLTSNRCQKLRWPGLVCCAARPGGRATPTTLLFARLFDPRPPHEEGNMLSNLGLEASRSGTRLAPLYAAYLLLFQFLNRGHCPSVRYAY